MNKRPSNSSVEDESQRGSYAQSDGRESEQRSRGNSLKKQKSGEIEELPDQQNESVFNDQSPDKNRLSIEIKARGSNFDSDQQLLNGKKLQKNPRYMVQLQIMGYFSLIFGISILYCYFILEFEKMRKLNKKYPSLFMMSVVFFSVSIFGVKFYYYVVRMKEIQFMMVPAFSFSVVYLLGFMTSMVNRIEILYLLILFFIDFFLIQVNIYFLEKKEILSPPPMLFIILCLHLVMSLGLWYFLWQSLINTFIFMFLSYAFIVFIYLEICIIDKKRPFKDQNEDSGIGFIYIFVQLIFFCQCCYDTYKFFSSEEDVQQPIVEEEPIQGGGGGDEEDN